MLSFNWNLTSRKAVIIILNNGAFRILTTFFSFAIISIHYYSRFMTTDKKEGWMTYMAIGIFFFLDGFFLFM